MVIKSREMFLKVRVPGFAATCLVSHTQTRSSSNAPVLAAGAVRGSYTCVHSITCEGAHSAIGQQPCTPRLAEHVGARDITGFLPSQQ